MAEGEQHTNAVYSKISASKTASKLQQYGPPIFSCSGNRSVIDHCVALSSFSTANRFCAFGLSLWKLLHDQTNNVNTPDLEAEHTSYDTKQRSSPIRTGMIRSMSTITLNVAKPIAPQVRCKKCIDRHCKRRFMVERQLREDSRSKAIQRCLLVIICASNVNVHLVPQVGLIAQHVEHLHATLFMVHILRTESSDPSGKCRHASKRVQYLKQTRQLKASGRDKQQFSTIFLNRCGPSLSCLCNAALDAFHDNHLHCVLSKHVTPRHYTC